MLNIFRHIPHPNYGHYGGANNFCDIDVCPIPIDWMDVAFAEHDYDLRIGDPLADHKLGVKLKKGSRKDLKHKSWWYRNAYYLWCRYILFRPKKTKKKT